MAISRFKERRRKSPGLKTTVRNTLAYPLGFDSFTANDLADERKLRLVTDARLDKLGQYITRKGLDFYTVPVGEASDDSESSATGAADQTVTNSTRFAQKFTAATSGRVTKLTLSAKNDESGTGVLRVDIYDDDSGEPGTLLGSSSIKDTDIGAAYADETAYFVDAPSVTATEDYWIVSYLQDNGTNNYKLESTTNSTDALKSTDSGASWSSQTFSLLFDVFVSTSAKTKGAFRAYKSDSTKKTLIAHSTIVSSVDDADGTLTSIKTGLNSGATNYYFEKVNDTVYYVNGIDSNQKWDFSTAANMGGSPEVSKNIKLHQNKLFFVSASDPNKIFWSNTTEYETFTSTDFIYVPDPKSSHPISGWESFNDVLYIFTEKDKYALYGNDLANFELDKAPGSKGTFSQECIQETRNHLYFCSNDGIYRFNGTSDELISAEITDIYESIADKTKIVTAVDGNRFYVFYPSAGSADNDTALVFNIDHDSWESQDLEQPVARAVNWDETRDSGELVLFSNLVAAGYKFGEASNNYSDAGRPLTYELRTRYQEDSSPQSKKLLRRLYPRFEKETGSHNVSVLVDRDFRDSPTTVSTVDLTTAGAEWGDGWKWGDGTVWGSAQLISPRVSVPGQSQYAQIRYRRTGVNTPVNFINHTLYTKTRRGI